MVVLTGAADSYRFRMPTAKSILKLAVKIADYNRSSGTFDFFVGLSEVETFRACITGSANTSSDYHVGIEVHQLLTC